ncbi:hypothetical protein V1506DRAFT_542446 [Lipomyces tetrasporus]
MVLSAGGLAGLGVLAYGPWQAAGVVAFGFLLAFSPSFLRCLFRVPLLYIYPVRFPFVPLFFAGTCL